LLLTLWVTDDGAALFRNARMSEIDKSRQDQYPAGLFVGMPGMMHCTSVQPGQVWCLTSDSEVQVLYEP
jgi:hypothetical protein